MNAVFSIAFLLSALLFLWTNPQAFLPAMLQGGQKSATLCLGILASYCVWLGFFQIMEQSGLSKTLSTALTPLCKRLFRTENGNALTPACCNLSANLLGLPGAPTPLGIQAVKAFYESGNEYGAHLLFLLNCAGLQLLPTTVLAMRASFGSLSPTDIVLPTLLCSSFATVLGWLLLRLSIIKLPRRKLCKSSR